MKSFSLTVEELFRGIVIFVPGLVKALIFSLRSLVGPLISTMPLAMAVRAVLRRGLPITEGVDYDGLKVDETSRTVTLRGKPVEITAGEFKLLLRLIAHRGRIFQRPADERTIDVQVANLRKKLGGWAEHIETVRGVGYRIRV